MSFEQVLAGFKPLGLDYYPADEPIAKTPVRKKIKKVKIFSSEALTDKEENPQKESSGAEEDEADDINDAGNSDDNDQDEDQDEDEAEPPEEENSNFYKQQAGRKSGIGRNAKRGALIGTPIMGLMVLFVIFLFLLGNLKAIHFSTILRSTGFAGSQFIMRQAFSEVAYTDWALERKTVELPKSRLLDKLRGQDMRKIQQRLSDEGTFNYIRDADGNAAGFEIKGEKIIFDELAKESGAKSFDDMSFKERMGARKLLTDKIKFEMGDTFRMETRGFRNGFWKGFREATGIKESFFRGIIRDKFGTGTVDGSADTDSARIGDEVKGTRGSGGEIDSSNPAVEEAAEDIPKTVESEAKLGRRMTAKKALGEYLVKKGSSLTEFESGMSELSTGVFVTTLYCMGHDLAHTGDRINQQMELSMARFGHQQQTKADQIRAGDVTSGDVAFANKEWGGDDETPDAAASPIYQQNIGNDTGNSGLDGAPRMNIAVPFLDWLKPIDNTIRTVFSLGLNHAPLVGGVVDGAIDKATTEVCGVVMNPYSQIAILGADAVVSVITLGTKELIFKGLQSVAMFAGFAGIGQLIESYINQVAGTGITGNEVGSDRFTASAVSTDYLNSQAGRGTTFAAPETSDQAAETKAFAMAELRDHYKSGSAEDRYLAITNPISLLGLTVAHIPSSVVSARSTVGSMLSNLGSIFTQPFRMIHSIFGNSKVDAASNTNVSKANDYFGVNQWGWSAQDQEALRNTNLGDNAVLVEQAMNGDPKYYEGLENCYKPNRLLSELNKDKNCSADKLSKDSRALKWRIYKLHQFAVDQMSSEGLYEN